MKWIFISLMTFSMLVSKQLPIVSVPDPVLRAQARALSKEEIVSPEIQQLIANMKETVYDQGVGLAAPQIGESIQLVVVQDREEFLKDIDPAVLEEREREPIAFHVLINPRITYREGEVAFFEGCLSVPDHAVLRCRSRIVHVTALNEQAEPVHIVAKGWYARILQHEIDHLQGILCVDNVPASCLISWEEYDYWRTRPIAEARERLN